jgi:hypothetical protein
MLPKDPSPFLSGLLAEMVCNKHIKPSFGYEPLCYEFIRDPESFFSLIKVQERNSFGLDTQDVTQIGTGCKHCFSTN